MRRNNKRSVILTMIYVIIGIIFLMVRFIYTKPGKFVIITMAAMATI
jgi:hypothetical protein